jgi:hypothetical protein
VCFFDGFCVVNSWWDAGECVVAGGHFSGVEKHANFLRFFLGAAAF